MYSQYLRTLIDIKRAQIFIQKQKCSQNKKSLESTVGADASVEVSKLHAHIQLLIARFYAHIDYNYHDEHLKFCCMQNPESQGNSKSGQ